MRKNCSDALDRFFARQASPRSVQGGSIWTDGEVLYSYATAILTRSYGLGLFFNRTRYSITTTIHQNAIAARLPNVLSVDGIPRGYGSLEALRQAGEEARTQVA